MKFQVGQRWRWRSGDLWDVIVEIVDDRFMRTIQVNKTRFGDRVGQIWVLPGERSAFELLEGQGKP